MGRYSGKGPGRTVDVESAGTFTQEQIDAIYNISTDVIKERLDRLGLSVLSRMPVKPRNGQIIVADGTNLNPLALGQERDGPYIFLNNIWNKLALEPKPQVIVKDNNVLQILPSTSANIITIPTYRQTPTVGDAVYIALFGIIFHNDSVATTQTFRLAVRDGSNTEIWADTITVTYDASSPYQPWQLIIHAFTSATGSTVLRFSGVYMQTNAKSSPLIGAGYDTVTDMLMQESLAAPGAFIADAVTFNVHITVHGASGNFYFQRNHAYATRS